MAANVTLAAEARRAMEQMMIELLTLRATGAAGGGELRGLEALRRFCSGGDPGHPLAASSDGGPSQQCAADGSAASAPSGRVAAGENIVLLQFEREEIKGTIIGAEKAARCRAGLDLLPTRSGPAY